MKEYSELFLFWKKGAPKTKEGKINARAICIQFHANFATTFWLSHGYFSIRLPVTRFARHCQSTINLNEGNGNSGNEGEISLRKVLHSLLSDLALAASEVEAMVEAFAISLFTFSVCLWIPWIALEMNNALVCVVCFGAY